MANDKVDIEHCATEDGAESHDLASEYLKSNVMSENKFLNYSKTSQYRKPRFSLIGKPINLKSTRQDAKYRKLQAKIYNFLERPKSWKAITYHVIVFASVFICLIFSVLSTVKDYKDIAGEILFYMELAMLFWFFSEYCLRMWSAGCRSRYQTWKGRFLFARRPFCIVDLIVINASIVVLALGTDRQMFAASALRGLRFFQILRMIRMDRRGGSWKLLASVVWAHRQELFTTVYIGFLGLILSSFLIYLVEKNRNKHIQNYADALWWGVITLCTVGYGDTVPQTWLGKIIAAFCAVAGISFFALPAGILGSGFALKVQQSQRQKHLIRRRVPAATLIQSLWRCYAADASSTSTATWKPHLKPLKTNHSDQMKSPNLQSSFTRERFSRFSRFSTNKKGKSGDNSSSGGLGSPNECMISEESGVVKCRDGSVQPYTPNRRNAVSDLDPNCAQNCISMNRSFVCLSVANDASLTLPLSMSSLALKGGEEEEHAQVRQLTDQHKFAIRSIRKIKYFVARKKFREALRPYDVKDVIEQYSAGHVDMLARVKILQARLDQILGRQNCKDANCYDSSVSLASRIVKVERSVEDIETKLDFLINLQKNESLHLNQVLNSLSRLGLDSSNATVWKDTETSLSKGKDNATSPSSYVSCTTERCVQPLGCDDNEVENEPSSTKEALKSLNLIKSISFADAEIISGKVSITSSIDLSSDEDGCMRKLPCIPASPLRNITNGDAINSIERVVAVEITADINLMSTSTVTLNENPSFRMLPESQPLLILLEDSLKKSSC